MLDCGGISSRGSVGKECTDKKNEALEKAKHRRRAVDRVLSNLNMRFFDKRRAVSVEEKRDI